MDDVANTNTNSDHDPDFNIFWKQLHQEKLSPKTVFNVQSHPRQQVECCSVTPKRMEYWDMAIKAGFTFADLESMVERHKHIALAPHVLLSDSSRRGWWWMGIRSLNLEFDTKDQFGEEDKQAIRFVVRLAVEHPPESSSDEGIHLPQSFVEMKQLHDIPLVTHCVDLWSCDLVDCDKLMFNISQNSKYVSFSFCELANGGADLCRWLSPNNCRIAEVSFFRTYITCDSLAKLFQSNKRINKLHINFCGNYIEQRTYSRQEIDQIIQLLSDASHLKKLKVANHWFGSPPQEQMTRFDALISLLGNKSLSCLTFSAGGVPTMPEIPPEILSAQMEALQQALEETTQLTYLDISPRPPGKHAHWYHALVERTLRRNYRTKMRSMPRSLPTWSRPLALLGKVLTTRSRRWGPMGSTNETFHLLLQCGELLERT